MTLLGSISSLFWRWIDATATTLVAGVERLTAPRTVQVVEQDDGGFVCAGERVAIADGRIVEPVPPAVAAAMKQARVDLVLRPKRFMFRPLELPARASEFLGGIVAAQIDRLTPWPQAEVAFGWTPPQPTGDDRIVVTIVATARAMFMPLLTAIAAQGPKTIRVLTAPPAGEDGEPVEVWGHAPGHASDLRRVRRVLAGIVLTLGLGATAALGTLLYVGGDLDAQRFDINRRIAERRANALLGRQAQTGLAALEKRKHETPSSVIVIDALSRVLPDHTFLTELRVAGDKLQIVGLSRDAPALIRLIEQSKEFTRATFFAPTTRSAGETNEHFNIEARILPVFTVSN